MEITTIEGQFAESLEGLKDHPFVTGAMAGSLTKEQGIRWVMCAGRESRSFPSILTDLLEWTDNERIRLLL